MEVVCEWPGRAPGWEEGREKKRSGGEIFSTGTALRYM